MTACKLNSSPLFGFIRVADLGGSVLIGGYLLLNALGRPLEFHCTEPVKPNRAQQILFGAVLDPYLYGEQIAKTLVDNSQSTPAVIFTDQAAVLSLRQFTETPVVWISQQMPSPPGYLAFQLGSHQSWVLDRYRDDQARVTSLYTQFTLDWDLAEPFQRIQEAVAELQKAA
jgi:hypothetical protein